MATLLDSIHRRLKGEPSEHTKEIDKQFEPIIEKNRSDKKSRARGRGRQQQGGY